MKSRVTINDVARQAGVSIGTVSRVLNGYRVRPGIQEKIREIARSLKYTPNISARGMRSGRKYCLGVLIGRNPDEKDPWLHEQVLTIARVATQHSYTCMVEFWDGQTTRMPRIINNVDGCIVFGAFPDVFFSKHEKDISIPLITYNERLSYKNNIVINVNFKGAMRNAVQYLFALKHRQVGLVLSRKEDQSIMERYECYRNAMREFGYKGPECVMQASTKAPKSWLEEGYKITVRMMAAHKGLTAIIYANDSLAIGGMAAIKDSGRRIPDDISVIGFDNISMGKVVTPALSTFGVNNNLMATMAIEAVEQMLNNREFKIPMQLDMEFIKRDSVGMCAEAR